MKDYIVRAVTFDGAVRCSAAVTTNMADEARRLHSLSPTASAALGRLLTAVSMMGNMMKGEDDRLTVQIDGKGPIGRLTAVSDSEGMVKGYVDNPLVDLPLKDGKLDVGGAVGTDGLLGIIQDLGLKEPYVGKVPLVSGEIGDDIAFYYAKSEQIPSVVALGVLVDVDMSVKAAGGLILQVMPEATDEQIGQIEEMVKNLPPISGILDEGATPEDLLAFALSSFDGYTTETFDIEYRCDCCIERIERAVRCLGKEEIEDIIEKQVNAELTCHFCNKKYVIDKERLTEIANSL